MANQFVQKNNSKASQPQNNVWSGRNKRSVENDLLMDGMDLMYGANRAINGATFGAVDWLGNRFGFDSQMNNYLQLKNPQARNITQIVGNVAELGGGALAANQLYNPIMSGYNHFMRLNGKRNLTNQLRHGNNFEDIYMGKVDKDKLDILNKVRQNENVEQISSGKVTIPKDRVQHVYEKRIAEDGYSPEDASNAIYDALFNPNSQIQPSRYTTLQKFESPTPNRAIVGKIKDGNNIFVKTGYKK